jgi:hypothetical protein
MIDEKTSWKTQIIVSTITLLGSVLVAFILGHQNMKVADKQIAENHKIAMEQIQAQQRNRQKQFEQSLSHLIISRENTLEYLQRELENNKLLRIEEKMREVKIKNARDGKYVAGLVATEIDYLIHLSEMIDITSEASEGIGGLGLPIIFDRILKEPRKSFIMPKDEIKSLSINSVIEVVNFYNSLRILEHVWNIQSDMYFTGKRDFFSELNKYPLDKRRLNDELSRFYSEMEILARRGSALNLHSLICRAVHSGSKALQSINNDINTDITINNYQELTKKCEQLEVEQSKGMEKMEVLFPLFKDFDETQDPEVLRKLLNGISLPQ